MTRLLWQLAGLAALGLGILGIALPLLPTTPFILLAVFCFSRSSERLHTWLITHKRFGPMIDNWHQHGAISRRAKVLSAMAMIAVFALSLFLGANALVLTIQAVVLGCAATFVLSRPLPPHEQ